MDEKERIAQEIRNLEAELASNASDVGDWKIIKCYEASLQKKPMPYDIDELMEARQKIRDRINELQKQLEEVEKGQRETQEAENE